MSELRRLQSSLFDYVMANGETVLNEVVSTASADAATRLDVYANAYRLRLIEALQTDFPGLHGLLGDEQFYQLCLDYIAACPSQHPSLRWFGAGMHEFTTTTSPYADQPLIGELALFEWTQGEVFDAADADVVAIDALAEVPPEQWETLCVRFHPSRRVIRLEWNVPPVWQALDAEETPPQPEQGAATDWLMWRLELQPHWRSLDEDEAWAVSAMAAGETFGGLCEGLCQRLPVEEVPLRAAGYLKQWLNDGLISRLGA